MRLRYSALHTAKAGSRPTDYEDSFARSDDCSVVAVADGAGSAFESGRWARLLTQSFIEAPPAGPNREEVLDWADQAAGRWTASIPWQELNFFELERAAEGSAATLVGLRLFSVNEVAGTWECVALGDSCLFQVSGDRLVRSVPLSEHAQFGRRPPLFYTMRPQTERVIGHLATPNGGWTAGDQFFLLTDAIAAWFLNEVEQGRKPWHLLAQLDQKSFETFVDEQRYLQLMEDDDVTAVLLQPLPVGVPVPVGPIPEPELELELEPELELGPELELEPEPEPQPEPVGVRGAGGGALPHWDERAERYLERLRKPSIVATLIVAIVIGFLIGKALGGGSTPTPTPTPVPTPTRTASPAPTVSEAQAMDTAADQFTNTLLNFHGGVGAYEQAMHSSVTPALAGRLPRLLGLRASGLTSLASTGTVVFTTPNLAAGTVYVGATQQLTKNGKPLASRFLVVRLTLAQVGTTWAVSDVTIQPAANRLFPPARSGKSASGSTGGSSN